jgi:hypothetical protein
LTRDIARSLYSSIIRLSPDPLHLPDHILQLFRNHHTRILPRFLLSLLPLNPLTPPARPLHRCCLHVHQSQLHGRFDLRVRLRLRHFSQRLEVMTELRCIRAPGIGRNGLGGSLDIVIPLADLCIDPSGPRVPFDSDSALSGSLVELPEGCPSFVAL